MTSFNTYKPLPLNPTFNVFFILTILAYLFFKPSHKYHLKNYAYKSKRLQNRVNGRDYFHYSKKIKKGLLIRY